MAGVACTRCGFDVAPGLPFCGGCGAPAGAAPSPATPSAIARRAERRQVTALFCDLVGSVSLSTTLDPEDLMHVLDVFQASCDDVIAQHGGYLAKFMGDGVLAYFGYPAADEEDAANAVRAALALRDAAGSLAPPGRASLQVRVGVATGMVVVNDLVSRGVVREVGIVGETPNLAARLQAAAPPGGIVMSEATRRIAGGLFSYRQLPPTELKGFAGPVEAFEVTEATEVGSRSRARSQRAQIPLVGRERELATLLGCWGRACAGQGQVVLLQGEAGIGKSMLIETLRRHAADAPHVHLAWFCSPTKKDTALHPVTEQLARAAGLERGEAAEARSEKLRLMLARHGAAGLDREAVIADLLGASPDADRPPEPMTPEKRKKVALDALLAVMDAWSGAHPALIVAEDLHWSDSTTLELLDLAVRQTAGRRWMILATARPEFQTSWSEICELVAIEPGRLTHVDAERLCMHVGATAMLPPSAIRQIIDRCDGIPLFIEEIARSVVEAVTAAPAQDGPARVVIPDTLHDSLVARLDRLGPARRIASLGAVIGRRFTHGLLTAVADMPPQELRQSLRDLTRSGLVERIGLPPASVYVFKHALVRDAAYDCLLKREREALHGRIAAVLRERFPELQETEPELLAHHLTESGAAAAAIPLWAAAGRRAALQGGHVEAVGHLETALALLRRQPDGEGRVAMELQLLVGLAASLSASRGFAAAEVGQILGQARSICDALENAPELFAVLRYASSFYIVAANLDPADETARLCLEIGERTGLPVHQVEGHFVYGFVRYMRGEFEAARFHLERAIEIYRQNEHASPQYPSPQDPGIGTLATLQVVYDSLGDRERLEQTRAELARRRAGTGDFNRVFSWVFDALTSMRNGKVDEALAISNNILSLAEENQFSLYIALGAAYATAMAAIRAPSADGAAAVVEALNRLVAIGCLISRPEHLAHLALAHAGAGDAQAALVAVDEGIALCGRTGEVSGLSELHRVRAVVLSGSAEHGEDEEAVAAAISVAEAQKAPGLADRAKATRARLRAGGRLDA